MEDKFLLKNFFKKLLNLNPIQRRYLLYIFDSTLILFSLIATHFLINDSYFNLNTLIKELSILIIFGIPIYGVTGQYKSLSRYVGSHSLYKLALRNLIITIIFFVFGIFGNSIFQLIKFSIVFFIFLTSFGGFARFASRDLLLKFTFSSKDKLRNIAIYGTGSSSAQLFASLKLSKQYKVICFIDDNPLVWERYLYNIKIISPKELSNIYSFIDQVFIVSTFKTEQKRKEFLKLLEIYNLPVMEIPSISQIASRRNLVEYLKPVKIEDLLGRNPEKSLEKITDNIINNKVVCVTGAGGSIGSELCRKIIELKPKLLILYENNEANLYNISNYLLRSQNIAIKPFLGSVSNEILLRKIFKDFEVDIVFHAAAYKHVPIVQENPLEGIKNNVLNTRLICKVALEENVNNLILISTDKAVRPTNVMGASKRVAELIVQCFAEERLLKNPKNKNNTIFSMVRFGNVLGSSGSVVPLFQKQISEGGPITLTDSNVIRYFMTIPEAAQLVIQAAAMAEGGELFLLDMGKPIKIRYLAEQMIRLNGLKIKSENHPDGDIEIKVTGLRPGEKLYEELLIDGKAENTLHPRIFKSRESFIQPLILWSKLDELELMIKKLDEDKVLKIISELVPEWEDERF